MITKAQNKALLTIAEVISKNPKWKCSPPVKKEWLKVENSINLNEGVFYEEIKIYR